MHEAGEHTWAFSRLAKLNQTLQWSRHDNVYFLFFWRLNDRELTYSPKLFCVIVHERASVIILSSDSDKHIEIYI